MAFMKWVTAWRLSRGELARHSLKLIFAYRRVRSPLFALERANERERRIPIVLILGV